MDKKTLTDCEVIEHVGGKELLEAVVKSGLYQWAGYGSGGYGLEHTPLYDKISSGEYRLIKGELVKVDAIKEEAERRTVQESNIAFMKHIRPDLTKEQCKKVDDAFGDVNPDDANHIVKHMKWLADEMYPITEEQLADIVKFNGAMLAEGFYVGRAWVGSHEFAEVDAKWREWATSNPLWSKAVTGEEGK